MKTITINRILIFLLTLCSVAALWAGIEGGGFFSKGAISRFGSVVVNGVKFETDTTVTLVNNQVGTLSDLEVGQVISVDGEINSDLETGVADKIVYTADFRGPVQQQGFDFIQLMGASVSINIDTQFGQGINSLSDIPAGDKVQVSGLLYENGVFLASWIGLDSDNILSSTGYITQLDVQARQFALNDLVVDGSRLSVTDVFEGSHVRVEGLGFDGNGRFVADTMEVISSILEEEEGEQIGIEGFISGIAPTGFLINNQLVVTDAVTQLEGGTQIQLVPNTRVSVDGTVIGQTLLASRVRFKSIENRRLAGIVHSVNVQTGTVDLMGTTISVNPFTQTDDDSDAELPVLMLSDLNVGDYIEVDGYESPVGSQVVQATKLEREEYDSESFIRGPVGVLILPEFTMLGTAVRTTANTEYEDGDENTVSPGTFETLAQHSEIKVEGVYVDGVLIADEIEIR